MAVEVNGEVIEAKEEELEDLFINNSSFNAIVEHVTKFNPIKIMGMERMEIRHSAILAWLMTPNETHGLGDQFLKSFLCEVSRSENGNGAVNALQIYEYNFSDAEIRREWKNIDIFVLSRSNNFVCVIENKFLSTQYDGQLKTYRELIESIFKIKDGFTILPVFLTLNEETPEDDQYRIIRYEKVCEILTQLIGINKNMMPVDARRFLEQYLEVIEEACGVNEQQKGMKELARKLYRQHKNALDFIVKHGANTDFGRAVHELFGEEPKKMQMINIDGHMFAYGGDNSDQVSFLPKSWLDVLGYDSTDLWPGCEKWWMEYPVIMWLQLSPNSDSHSGVIRLYAEVGRLSDYESRRSLIESIEEAAQQNEKQKRISFTKSAKNSRAKYSKFLKENSSVIEDRQDAEMISKEMRSLLREFEDDIRVIAIALDKWVRTSKAIEG